MTYGELKNLAEDRLTLAGIADAGSDVRIMLTDLAGAGPAFVAAHAEDEVPAETLERFMAALDRRVRREPLQYVCGSWNFMGLDFTVRTGVLIPRQDTEILVEEVLRVLHDGMRILDVCTGSGCILISLLRYSNDCIGTGCDASPKALAVARENAAALLDDMTHVMFCEGDLYGALEAGGEAPDGGFDVIVSNPPYVPSEVIDTLEPEVRDHEPRMALDGGRDGLDLIRRIIDGAGDHLIKGGALYLEIGFDQGAAVSGLMKAAGFAEVEVIRDYAGLDRVVRGTRPILEGSISAG